MSSEIDRSLGRLEASMEAIRDMVEKQSDKLDRIADDAHSTRSRVEKLEARMGAVEPTVNEMEKWRERLVGIRLAAVMLWMTIGGAITSGLAWLWAHAPFGKGP